MFKQRGYESRRAREEEANRKNGTRWFERYLATAIRHPSDPVDYIFDMVTCHLQSQTPLYGFLLNLWNESDRIALCSYFSDAIGQERTHRIFVLPQWQLPEGGVAGWLQLPEPKKVISEIYEEMEKERHRYGPLILRMRLETRNLSNFDPECLPGCLELFPAGGDVREIALRFVDPITD